MKKLNRKSISVATVVVVSILALLLGAAATPTNNDSPRQPVFKMEAQPDWDDPDVWGVPDNLPTGKYEIPAEESVPIHYESFATDLLALAEQPHCELR